MPDDTLQTRVAAEWEALLLAGFRMPVAAGVSRPSRIEVIAELEELRLFFGTLRGSLDETACATLVTTRWTVRDVLAHLASWAKQTRVELDRIAASEPFDETIDFGPGGPHAWNQREVDARRAVTLDELFDELDVETLRTIEYVVSAPDDVIDGIVELPRTMGDPPQPWRFPLGYTLVKMCWHTRYHLKRLREQLARE
jgi:hypothetical protein